MTEKRLTLVGETREGQGQGLEDGLEFPEANPAQAFLNFTLLEVVPSTPIGIHVYLNPLKKIPRG